MKDNDKEKDNPNKAKSISPLLAAAISLRLKSLAKSPEIRKEAEIEEKGYKQNYEDTRVEELKSNIKLRNYFSIGAYFLVITWLILIGYIVLCAGTGRLIFFEPAYKYSISLKPFCIFIYPAFTLDNSVLITLISGSTVNVIGLLATVLLYLFPPFSRKSSANIQDK